MSTFFFIGAGVAMILTLVAIVVGLFSMGKNSDFREKYGNKLMQARVMMQALAIIFLILAFSTS